MASMNQKPRNVFGATLSRRHFMKAGGILAVGFSVVGPDLLKADGAKPAASPNSLDPTLPGSWIEIHPDNTVLIRTGKSDFGQGTTFTAYRQIVADELSVPFEAITTVVQGDTDRTPDGSGAFDFLGRGVPNIRKAAAYTYQALLDLASERLGRAEGEALGEGRRRLGRRQEHLVRRPRQGPAVEAHDPRQGRAHQHRRAQHRGQSADEGRQRVHGHRQVLQELGHRFEGGREGDMGDGCAPPGHAPCARGASEDPRVDSRVRRSGGQEQVPERPSRREGQPRRRRRAHGMGSDRGRGSRRQRHEVDGVEGPSGERQGARASEGEVGLDGRGGRERAHEQG